MFTESLILQLTFNKPVPVGEVTDLIEEFTRKLFEKGLIDEDQIFDATAAPHEGQLRIVPDEEVGQVIEGLLEQERGEAVPVLSSGADKETVVAGSLPENLKRAINEALAKMAKGSAGGSFSGSQEGRLPQTEDGPALPDRGDGRLANTQDGDQQEEVENGRGTASS